MSRVGNDSHSDLQTARFPSSRGLSITRQPEYTLDRDEDNLPPVVGQIVMQRRTRPKLAKEHRPGLRRWLRFNETGNTTWLQADKFAIVHELGVRLRDLRIIDPNPIGATRPQTYLAHSSRVRSPMAILIRERALVVSLEDVKCIISTDQVLVLDAVDSSLGTLTQELYRRLNSPPHPDDPPYELKALEVCLDVSCRSLEQLASSVESESLPTLDALAGGDTSPKRLELVRRLKSRMVHLVRRTEASKEVLEKLLADDKDMRDMVLSAKILTTGSQLGTVHEDAAPHDGGAGPSSGPAAAHDAAAAEDAAAPREPDDAVLDDNQGEPAAHPTGSLGTSWPHSVSRLTRASLQRRQSGVGNPSASGDSLADTAGDDMIAEVEMLLEAYYMQADNTLERLRALQEYVGDTEDLLEISMDSLRNRLITLELMLTLASLSVAFIAMVAGVFGMNMKNTFEESTQAFIVTVLISCVVATSIFAGGLLWCRRQRWLPNA
ncbi:unnamed protein product [Pedinophyceae sp. YPF-701]|nr:unnamed protein product [Pedinophyceae sp. YPF-701]